MCYFTGKLVLVSDILWDIVDKSEIFPEDNVLPEVYTDI